MSISTQTMRTIVLGKFTKGLQKFAGTTYCETVICRKCEQPMKQKLFALLCEDLQNESKIQQEGNIYVCLSCGIEAKVSLKITVI